MIDSALFVLSLDGGCPETSELFNGRPYIHAQSNALETNMVIDDFVKFFHGNPDGFWSIMTPRKDL